MSMFQGRRTTAAKIPKFKKRTEDDGDGADHAARESAVRKKERMKTKKDRKERKREERAEEPVEEEAAPIDDRTRRSSTTAGRWAAHVFWYSAAASNGRAYRRNWQEAENTAEKAKRRR